MHEALCRLAGSTLVPLHIGRRATLRAQQSYRLVLLSVRREAGKE